MTRGRSVECESLEAVIGQIVDDQSRSILAAATTEPVVVKELVERCNVSPSSAYRKTDELVAAGFLTEDVRINENKKNSTEYTSRIVELSVDLSDVSADTLSGVCVMMDRNSEEPQKSDASVDKRGHDERGSKRRECDSPRDVGVGPVPDERARRLGSLFQELTGTEDTVEKQETGVSSRIVDDSNVTQLSAATDDGLGDAIGAGNGDTG